MLKKNEEEIKIKFKAGVKSDKEGIKRFDYDYISAGLKCTKRYNTAVCLLMGISGCGLHLIEWITTDMGSGSYIVNNDVTRATFIEFHKTHAKKGTKAYSEHSVIKAFQDLSSCDILIPVTKGMYKVNPLLYFNGGVDKDEDRIKAIVYTMEFIAGQETKIKRSVKK